MLFLLLYPLLASATGSLHYPNHGPPHQKTLEAFASRTYFYTGGQYVNHTLPTSNTSQKYMEGQIYIEHLIPLQVTKPHPIVFIHGNAQSGTNWLNTPDGREGWASRLLREGYEVYITDQAARGRSPFLPGRDGNLTTFSTQQIENMFTAPQNVEPLPYPQAALHDKWPGKGIAGDPIFDTFYSSQVPALANQTLQSLYDNHSYTSLLQHINTPVYVITHSQAGPWGFQLADSVPDLVEGLISLEPQGPVFQSWSGPPFTAGYSPTGGTKRWGLTDLPLHYDPPLGQNNLDYTLLQTKVVPRRDANSSDCTRQKSGTVRKLANLAEVPMLMLTSEASYHIIYDYCVANYLEQGGVDVDHVQLGDVGIHGGGHFIFLELSSMRTLEEVVLPWLEKNE